MDAGVGGVEERVDGMGSDASDLGGMAADSGVEDVRQEVGAVEEDAQGVEDVAVQELQVAAVDEDECEVILTTFMVVNAAVLLEATGNKIKEFRGLVKVTEPKPHVIVVHEMNGFSGEARVRDVLLHGALAMYDVVYSQKLKLSETGARAGGGIMCLFKRELFHATNVQPPRGLDTSLLDGHVRTWCPMEEEASECFALDCDDCLYST